MGRPASSDRINTLHFGFQRNPQITLARTLWLQGFPDQAIQAATQAASKTTASQDIVSACIALIWAAPLFCWIGDWATVEKHTEQLIADAGRHSLAPYLAVGEGIKGQMLIKRGDFDRGINLLRASLANLEAHQYELYTPELKCALAEGFAMTGNLDQAFATVDETITLLEQRGDLFIRPELLRIRGELLAQAADIHGAQECFRQSIEFADRQSALSWRLRTVTSLARLRLRQNQHEEARVVLAETFARFEEGFDTADLKAAKVLLDEMKRSRRGLN